MVTTQVFLVENNEIEDRLDVQYFTPEIRENLKQLNNLSAKLIEFQDLCQTINRGRQPKYVDDGEVPIVKTVDISKEGVIDWENTTRTNFDFFDGNISAQIKQGDILLTSTGVGSLGKLTFIEEKREAVVDGHITIIRVDKKIINPKFVFVFLKSKLGRIQIERQIRGTTGQIEIYPTDLKTMLIPIPKKDSQEKIIKIYSELDKKRIEVKKFIFNSPALRDNLLVEGYKKIMDFLQIKHPKRDGKGTLLIVPPFKITDRLDFMYHKKDCTKMITEIKSSKTPHCQLKEMVKFRKEKINQKGVQDETFNYVTIADVNKKGIFRFTSLTGRELPSRAKNIVYWGDIIVPLLLRCKESASIVDKEHDGFLVSTGFAVLIPNKNVDMNYLYMMLKSPFIKKQIEQRTTGAIMESVSLSELGEVTLPYPNLKNQKKCLEIFSEYEKNANKILQESINLNNQLKEMENKFENNFIRLLNK